MLDLCAFAGGGRWPGDREQARPSAFLGDTAPDDAGKRDCGLVDAGKPQGRQRRRPDRKGILPRRRAEPASSFARARFQHFLASFKPRSTAFFANWNFQFATFFEIHELWFTAFFIGRSPKISACLPMPRVKFITFLTGGKPCWTSYSKFQSSGSYVFRSSPSSGDCVFDLARTSADGRSDLPPGRTNNVPMARPCEAGPASNAAPAGVKAGGGKGGRTIRGRLSLANAGSA